MAVRFDASKLEVSGAPETLVEDLREGTFTADYDVSPDGMLAYVQQSREAYDRLPVIVDRRGIARPLPGLAPAYYQNPAFSPDGRRLALMMTGSMIDILIYDFARASLTTAHDRRKQPIPCVDLRRKASLCIVLRGQVRETFSGKALTEQALKNGLRPANTFKRRGRLLPTGPHSPSMKPQLKPEVTSGCCRWSARGARVPLSSKRSVSQSHDFHRSVPGWLTSPIGQDGRKSTCSAIPAPGNDGRFQPTVAMIRLGRAMAESCSTWRQVDETDVRENSRRFKVRGVLSTPPVRGQLRCRRACD